MTLEIILVVALLGIALSMDAFAVSITQGLTIKDLNKKRIVFIAFIYGLFQGLFPLTGYFITKGLIYLFEETIASSITDVISIITTILASVLLLFIGIKMIIDTVKEVKEDGNIELRDYKASFIIKMGVITAIDALATGVALESNLSNNRTIFLHVSIIMVITFIICLIGVILSNKINKLMKNKPHLALIIGGVILILLAIWISLSEFLNIL